MTILILSGLSVGALQTSNKNVKVNVVEENSALRGTHTAFGGYGTTTWCSACRYAHSALKELYAENQLDFNYVSFVCDMNPVAYSYIINHFNLFGYPTLWWDGGYKVNLGAGSVNNTKTTYTTSINDCVARAVKDVDITLDVTWLGGTEMQIYCSIDNNETINYGGTIRVYITEKVSSMGWYDTGGSLYTHTFLDFAFNQVISIPAGGTWNNSMNWIGSEHGYPTVTENNTMVIAVVENDEWHQGYSYPPSNNPFDAYYVDACVTVDLGLGSAPSVPLIGGPTVGLTGNEYDFEFVSIDPDDDDVLYFIDWGDGTNSGWMGPYTSGATIIISKIYNAAGTYDITAKAKDTNTLQSDWSNPLTIEISGNKAPEIPTITGPATGKINVATEYNFTTTDPDGDDVYYFIDWDDGTNSSWIGPYPSGATITRSHTWSTKGTYTIKAKAKDNYGGESDWGNLIVVMPYSYNILSLPFFDRFFQRFPNAFPLLRHMMGNLENPLFILFFNPYHCFPHHLNYECRYKC